MDQKKNKISISNPANKKQDQLKKGKNLTQGNTLLESQNIALKKILEKLINENEKKE